MLNACVKFVLYICMLEIRFKLGYGNLYNKVVSQLILIYLLVRIRDEGGRQDQGPLLVQAQADGLGTNAGTIAGNTRQTGSGNGDRKGQSGCDVEWGVFQPCISRFFVVV